MDGSAIIKPLDPAKFCDPSVTADGSVRAAVALDGLDTLWINTGTLCNLTCENCYIESSPLNDRLAYITAPEAASYLDEIEELALGTTEIGFTGGEPFMNPHIIVMLDDVLSRGHRALVLTNAMRPMRRHEAALLDLRERFGAALTIRVSVDHYTQDLHEAERGANSWDRTIEGLVWLARNGFRIDVAGRTQWGESEEAMRGEYASLFGAHDIPIDVADPARMVLFPEMDATVDVPEITEQCWSILGVAPGDMMCSSSRMVVKRKGADKPAVVACTLLPYEPAFELGETLAEARDPIALNHPHCAKFCVLGGGACSKG